MNFLKNYINGYGLNNEEYEELLLRIYGFEEYYYYKQDKHYKDYLFIVNELDKIKNDKLMNPSYKNAIIGWFLFFKFFPRHMATSIICFNITDACQLQCKHCFNQNNKRTNKHMTFDEFVYLFYKHQEIAKKFVHYDKKDVYKVGISGGEATLNPDLPKIMNFLNNKKINISLDSNGIYTNDEIIYQLSKNKQNLINISIDGMYETHDFIRGKETFNKSVETIKKMISNNIKVQTSFCVNSYNYKDINEYEKYFSNLGVYKTYIIQYIDHGNEFITPIDKNVLSHIKNKIHRIDNYICNAGVQSNITWDGKFRPCGKLGIPYIADYYNDTEEEFIKKIKLFTLAYRSAPVYCFDCKKIRTCFGRQRCNKETLSNSFNIADITCIKLQYKEITNLKDNINMENNIYEFF